VLIAVDDAQWLDEPTLAALRFALRRVMVPVLLSSRQGTDGAALIEDADVLAVSPLGAEDLDSLLRMRLSAAFRRPTLLEIARVSGGNPFYALELARALIALPEQPAPSDPLPVPPRLRELVEARLDRLTSSGRTAALFAATAVRPTRALLEKVAGSGTDELFTEGVVVGDGERVRFAHPLLAASVYASADPSERTAAHRALATVAADPEERGHHVAAAADAPDPEVADAVFEAAAHARARGAVTAAAQLAARAVALTPPAQSAAVTQRRLYEADAWIAAGNPERAKAVLEDALAAASGRERSEVLLAMALLATNRTQEQEQAVVAADAGLLNLDPAEADLRARLQLVRHHALRILDRDDDADAALRDAAAAAEDAEDATLLSRILAARFFIDFELGRGDDIPSIRRAIELLEQRPPSEQQADTDNLWALYHYANYLTATGQAADARLIYGRLRERERALGSVIEAHYLDLAGVNEFFACQYDDAERLLGEAEQLSRQTGYPATTAAPIASLALIQIYRGDLDGAAQTITRLQECADAVAPGYGAGEIAAVNALLAFSRGDFVGAAESFAVHESMSGEIDPALRPFVPIYAEALSALGRLDEARALLDPFEQLARANDRPVRLAAALRSRAILSAAKRDRPTAGALFEEALAQHRRLDNPFEHARTLLAYGTFSLGARRRGAARELLVEAHAIFESLGCSGWARRVQDELSRLGGRAPQMRGLTPTEARVAGLVSRGRSNAAVANELFMSPKTVEWNLSKIYKKLGVHSRTELAAKLGASTGATSP
jgi:DNA-binding CsgD family transcriptional regulator